MYPFRKVVSLAAALVVVMWLPAGADTGAVSGGMVTGKQVTYCNSDGTSDVRGPGLGVPLLNGPKTAHYKLDVYGVAGRPTASPAGLSLVAMRACGPLAPAFKQPLQMGAACGMSKSYGGKGGIVYQPFPSGNQGDVTYTLRNVKWKLSGATILFSAQGQPATSQGAQSTVKVIGLLQVRGDSHCLNKAEPKAITGYPGNTQSSLIGVFTTMDGALEAVPDPNASGSPGTCKDTANPACLYESKASHS